MSKTYSVSAPGSIDVRDLVVEYPLYQHVIWDRFRALIGIVFPAWRPPVRRILNRISFSIGAGEIVAFVGRNGAGKTSLLKVVSGLLRPTAGHVCVNGQLMALLAMGIGFRPALTGRENLLYCGLLLGLEKHQIRGLIPEIVQFAELENAIDQPFFTYSSGMKARLAFSLAVAVPADIVILDETLAVGDAKFVTKCYRRLREIEKSGKTILMVSHQFGEVARLASRVVVLDSGEIVHDGNVLDGLRAYEKLLADAVVGKDNQLGRYGVLDVSVNVYDNRGEELVFVRVGQPVKVELTVRSPHDLGDQFVVLRITDIERGHLCSYLMPSRWDVLGRRGISGNDNIFMGAGETRVAWELPYWVVGEGFYSFDVYLGPSTDIATLDLSQGNFWTAVGKVAVHYDNEWLRGSLAAVEFPIDRVHVRRNYHVSHLRAGKGYEGTSIAGGASRARGSL
jgi:ABC-type polysaccharide/polyol phosphate transport system ATPase subunit